jgi:hypothetical protein
VLADIVVRLYRRVEGLMALPQVPTDLLPPSNMDDMNDMNDMGAGMDMMDTDLNNMPADIDMGSVVMDDVGLNGGGDVSMNTGMESLADNDNNDNGNNSIVLEGLPVMSGLEAPPGGEGDANLFDGLDDTHLDIDNLEWPDDMNMS